MYIKRRPDRDERISKERTRLTSQQCALFTAEEVPHFISSCDRDENHKFVASFVCEIGIGQLFVFIIYSSFSDEYTAEMEKSTGLMPQAQCR